jgi:FkbM family methyltransferase
MMWDMGSIFLYLSANYPGSWQTLRKFKELGLKVCGKPFDPDYNVIKLLPAEAGQQFIDVGANRGQSIQAFITMNTLCSIHSFEPNPQLYKKCKKTYAANKRVSLYNVALWKESGELRFYIPIYKGTIYDSLASISEDAPFNWLKHRMPKFDEKQYARDVIKVPVRILDEFELEPCLIKIDVEGSECGVLEGGRKCIEKYKPALMLESASGEAMNLLTKMGYGSFIFAKGKIKKSQVEGERNTFFLHKEHWRCLFLY